MNVVGWCVGENDHLHSIDPRVPSENWPTCSTYSRYTIIIETGCRPNNEILTGITHCNLLI